MIQIKNFYFNDFRECCSVIWDESGECVIVDPGCGTDSEKERLYGFIGEKGLNPVKILLTHGHFDHVLGLTDCSKKYGVPVYMHPADKEILKIDDFFTRTYGFRMPVIDVDTTDIADGDIIRFGNTEFEVIHTPGHTPGCVCYYDEKDRILLSGDTLFAGSIGRTDHPGGDYDRLMESIFSRLMCLDGDIAVIPGHGPKTSIADERTKNPFLQPFNLPEEGPEELPGNEQN